MSHKAGGGLFALLVLGGVAVAAFTKHEDSFAKPELGQTIAEGGSVGCTSFKDTLRFDEFVLTGDAKASHDYITPRFDLGVCGYVEKGDKIVIEQKAHFPEPKLDKTFHGMICARKLGKTECIWLLTSYVFPKLKDSAAN